MRRHAVLLVLGLTGCVYYNGMYNANRLAKRAQKAQAQGRTFEAQGFWAQAEVRADTVIARHPQSNWVDDAQLIRGEAMVARKDCSGAVPALDAASLSRDSPKVAERARVLLSRCLLEQGDYLAADRVLVELMASPDTAVSRPAQLDHARLLRLDGRYQEALTTLAGMEGTAVDAERAADYANLGDLAAAEPLIQQALAQGDLSLPWESVIAGIGRVDRGLASQYTTAAIAMPGLPSETRDQLLLADGMRLLSGHADSGLARLREAGGATPVTFASLTAQLRIAEYTLGKADTLSQLEEARPQLVGAQRDRRAFVDQGHELSASAGPGSDVQRLDHPRARAGRPGDVRHRRVGAGLPSRPASRRRALLHDSDLVAHVSLRSQGAPGARRP